MNGLADELDRLSHRADHVDIELAIDAAIDAAASPARTPGTGRGHARVAAALLVAAAVITVVGLAAIAGRDRDAARGGPASESPTEPAPVDLTDEELAPVVTLDPDRTTSEGPPVTVVDTGPTEWYELQPDLDVAWYSDSSGNESWLCFRSPAGQECRPDRFAPTEYGGGRLVVATGGGQALIVTLDPGDDITVTLRNGATHRVPVSRDPEISWGIARIELPPGETVEEAYAAYLFDRPEADPEPTPPVTAAIATGEVPFLPLIPGNDWAYSTSEVTRDEAVQIQFIYTARPGDSDDTQHGAFWIEFGKREHNLDELLTVSSSAMVLGLPIELRSDDTGTLHAASVEIDNTPVHFIFEMVDADVARATLNELQQAIVLVAWLEGFNAPDSTAASVETTQA